jgi:lipopolysaccharide export LptBFGC system permease protein LptF
MKFLRPIIAVVLAFFLAYAMPGFLPSNFVGRLDVVAALLFAVIFGIFTALSVMRRERIKEAVALELNKIRRVYHLGKNLSGGAYVRAWFTQLHGFIYDYLGSFDKTSLADYDHGNTAFRKLAYHIYALPEIREVKEGTLYNALIDAAGQVSEARQKISHLLKSRFWKSHSIELGMAFIFFIVSVLSSTSSNPVSRVGTFAILAIGFILVDQYLVHDIWTDESDRRLAGEYVKNISRLELKRE